MVIIEVEDNWLPQLTAAWGEKAARHLHFADGFTLYAKQERHVVGLISAYWRKLPSPLDTMDELYIDFIEVKPEYRRQGIASHLIEHTIRVASNHNAYQVRSWSSNDKLAAIQMWARLGFGLCPATSYTDGRRVDGFFVIQVLGEP